MIDVSIKDKFPHDNLVSRWIMGLALIHNQLVLIRKSNLLLMEKSEINFITEESFLSFSLMSSTLREALRYLDHTKNEPEIINYMHLIPSNIKENYDYLLSMFNDEEELDIFKRMTRLRNITFHFSKPNDKKKNELQEALRNSDSTLLYTEDMEYFNFAIGISNHIFLYSLFDPSEIKDKEFNTMRSAVTTIKDTTSVLIEFSNKLVKYYLKEF